MASRLIASVRLLSEPCLWCWEIRDETDGALVESSWLSAWTAYESREAALAAGQRRLAEIREGLALRRRAS
jgi:hypothetical protein